MSRNQLQVRVLLWTELISSIILPRLCSPKGACRICGQPSDPAILVPQLQSRTLGGAGCTLAAQVLKLRTCGVYSVQYQ